MTTTMLGNGAESPGTPPQFVFQTTRNEPDFRVIQDVLLEPDCVRPRREKHHYSCADSAGLLTAFTHPVAYLPPIWRVAEDSFVLPSVIECAVLLGEIVFALMIHVVGCRIEREPEFFVELVVEVSRSLPIVTLRRESCSSWHEKPVTHCSFLNILGCHWRIRLLSLLWSFHWLIVESMSVRALR